MTDTGETITLEDLQPAAELLVGTGLLWAINRYVLHPRGFALAVDPDTSRMGLLGDGAEVWQFDSDLDQQGAERFEALLARLRDERKADR